MKKLRILTDDAVKKSVVIDEGFVSAKNPEKVSAVWFEENLSLISACKSVDKGNKTAILNFANPLEPGGGILRGANSQEEYLCRATNLYNCLISKHVSSYYLYHHNIYNMNTDNKMFLATDKIIYSPNVSIIKEDINYKPDTDCKSEQIYTDNWHTVDIITCAAPYFSTDKCELSDGDLYHLFTRRISNIFESAIEYDIDTLILGAFGCGAFHNPPEIVANAFYNVCTTRRYERAFTKVFAVKRSGYYCENIEVFDSVFGHFPQAIISNERAKLFNKNLY
ncbi:MAG: TIGR02452 family protein [Clostridia bacterium]|nr:TIGR02452 family protein [Clostridia bacterium]